LDEVNWRGVSKDKIVNVVFKESERKTAQMDRFYGSGKASDKIVRILIDESV